MNIKTSLRNTSEQTPFSKSKTVRRVAYLVLGLAGILVAYPLLFLLFTSLKTQQEFYMNLFGLTVHPQWGNYRTAWQTGKLSQYFFNSFSITVVSVGIVTIVTTLGGYALGKMRIPGSELIITLFMMFNFVPGIAIYIPLYKMMANMRMLDSSFSLILPYAAWQIPFSMYIFKQFFATIPDELVEAGRIDGCSEFQSFFYIVLPLVKPALATVIVFTFISNWGELMWAQIVTSSSIHFRTLPVGLLNFKTEMGVDWGPYAAGLCVVTLPILVVFGYFQKYFIAGLTQGAVKA